MHWSIFVPASCCSLPAVSLMKVIVHHFRHLAMHTIPLFPRRMALPASHPQCRAAAFDVSSEDHPGVLASEAAHSVPPSPTQRGVFFLGGDLQVPVHAWDTENWTIHLCKLVFSWKQAESNQFCPCEHRSGCGDRGDRDVVEPLLQIHLTKDPCLARSHRCIQLVIAPCRLCIQNRLLMHVANMFTQEAF